MIRLKITSIPIAFCLVISIIEQAVAQDNSRISEEATYVYRMVPKAQIKRLNDINYISQDSYREAVTFFDPYGRPILETAFKVKNNLDLVKAYAYDSEGRPSIDYLPFTAATDKGFLTDPLPVQANYYANSKAVDNIENDTRPWSTSTFEASPLGRVISVQGSGQAWNNPAKETSYSYRANSSNEVFRIESGSSEGAFTVNGFWPAGTLLLTETTTPDNRNLKQYKDGNGRLIISDQDGYKTYFIYDEVGRLEYVLPPLASEGLAQNSAVKLITSPLDLTNANKDPNINSYLVVDGASVTLKSPFTFTATSNSKLTIKAATRLYFHYIYDNNNRVVIKYQPSKKAEEFVYDKLDRVIMYRDGNLLDNNQWKYIKYDIFSRMAYWGVINSTANRQTLQDEADNTQQDGFELYTQNTTVYTLNNSYPDVTGGTNMQEFHYDNHFDLAITSQMGTGLLYTLGSAKGMVTKVCDRIMGTSGWVTTYFGYDAEGQLVVTKRVNDLRGSVQLTYAQYSFAGQVTNTRFIHCEGNQAALTVDYAYTYTPNGQVSTIDRAIPNIIASERIASYEYNALGEQITRKLGVSNGAGLQEVNYFYNLRGWLTSINDFSPTSTNDLFSQVLHYADGLAALSGTPNYDGRISGMEWRVKGSSRMGYGYQYDTHGRLTNAKNASGDNLNQNIDGYNESYTYDSNSNIKSLQRKGKLADNSYSYIDNLSYSYSGNQLENVSDASGGATNGLGFKDMVTPGVEYTYDSNGNMKNDLNKGISSITYNILNLPQVVTIGSPTTAVYTFTYSASGEKLRVVDQGSKTLFYDGPLTFDNTTLKSVATSEGRLNASGFSSYTQEYFLTDNQGNVRVTFQNVNGVASLNSEANYYPSGLIMAGDLNKPGSAVNRFAFGGKEEYDSPLSWLDFHARMYDPSIARWHVPDPMAERFTDLTPYSYCAGDPVNMTDPTGMEIIYGAQAELWWAINKDYLISLMSGYPDDGEGCSATNESPIDYMFRRYEESKTDYWIDELIIAGKMPPYDPTKNDVKFRETVNNGQGGDPYAKYGNVLGGVNLSGTLALGGGGALEFGYVVTDKGYRQNYITLYTAATISASASYNMFFVRPTGSKNGVTIGDWKGPYSETGVSAGLFGVQWGGSESGYTTYTIGFGPSLTFPSKGTGGGFTGNTFLIGSPTPFTNPGTLDPAGSIWFSIINW